VASVRDTLAFCSCSSTIESQRRRRRRRSHICGLVASLTSVGSGPENIVPMQVRLAGAVDVLPAPNFRLQEIGNWKTHHTATSKWAPTFNLRPAWPLQMLDTDA
jgi:hypothetical protein